MLFISYSIHDIKIVEALYSELKRKNVDCWIDKKEILQHTLPAPTEEHFLRLEGNLFNWALYSIQTIQAKK